MFQNVSIQNQIKTDHNGTTKIHVVRLSDGKVTTIDTNAWTMVFHFGNSWQLDDHNIVIEGAAVERKDNDPFNTLHRQNMQSAKDLANDNGSKFKRF